MDEILRSQPGLPQHGMEGQPPALMTARGATGGQVLQIADPAAVDGDDDFQPVAGPSIAAVHRRWLDRGLPAHTWVDWLTRVQAAQAPVGEVHGG